MATAHSRFSKAQRSKKRLRLAVDGGPGSGKSFSLLSFAHGLASIMFPDQPTDSLIAVIDTEHESASVYEGEIDEFTGKPWAFATTKLKTFAPTEYTAAIRDAEREGFRFLIIDSFSHAWAGKGGALEIKDASSEKNEYSAWGPITKMQNEMVDTILASPCHVLLSMRNKIEHVLQANEKGKLVPVKVGMAPIQRAGVEYEFDIYGSMDAAHTLTVSKSRCKGLQDAVVVKPGGRLMTTVAEWLTTGVDAVADVTTRVERLTTEQLERIVTLKVALKKNDDAFATELLTRFQTSDPGMLRPDQAEELIFRMMKEQERKTGQSGVVAAAVTPHPAAQAGQSQPAAASQPQANGTAASNGQSHPPQAVAAAKLSDAQLETLRQLRDGFVDRHGLTGDDWLAIVAKRGVQTARDLTPEQASELITAMTGKLAKLDADLAGNV